MNKRIFIAIPCSDEFKKEYQKIRNELSKHKVKWIDPNDMHITLVPPWYVDTKDIPAIKEKLAKICTNLNSVNVSLDRIEFGQGFLHKKFIWGRGTTKEDLSKFVDSFKETFEVVHSNRPFMLHVTLAIIKPYQIKELPNKIKIKVKWKQKVTEVNLLESLDPNGEKRYKMLASFRLGNHLRLTTSD